MYAHHVTTWCLRRPEEGVGPLNLELGPVESHVGVSNWTWAPWKNNQWPYPRVIISPAPRLVLPTLMTSHTPSLLNHCSKSVVLKYDPYGVFHKTLSCGLQGQNFLDSKILPLPLILSKEQWVLQKFSDMLSHWINYRVRYKNPGV